MACGLPAIGYGHDLEESLKKLKRQHEREELVKWQNEILLSAHKVEAVANRLIGIYESVFQ